RHCSPSRGGRTLAGRPSNNAVAEQCLQRDRWAAIFHYTNFQNGVLLAQKEGIFYAKNHEAPG
ncbi:hypothetical protein QIG76_28530, partial [Klebsiella pneumoniae]|nr:hypothetical protein [Klebsiella pneumoniae]